MNTVLVKIFCTIEFVLKDEKDMEKLITYMHSNSLRMGSSIPEQPNMFNICHVFEYTYTGIEDEEFFDEDIMSYVKQCIYALRLTPWEPFQFEVTDVKEQLELFYCRKDNEQTEGNVDIWRYKVRESEETDFRAFDTFEITQIEKE